MSGIRAQIRFFLVAIVNHIAENCRSNFFIHSLALGLDTHFTYVAFGLKIQSSIECPELVPFTSDVVEQFEPHQIVSIRESALDPRDFESLTVNDWFRVEGDTLFFSIESIGRFRITDGKDIRFERDPTLPEGTVLDEDIRVFLLGSCLGTALMQRGHFVLHASVGIKNGMACAIMGHSGAGKSTTMGIAINLGWSLISDDLCAIYWQDDMPMVFPAYPQLKLNDDSANYLQIPDAKLKWINRFKSKKALKVPNEFSSQPIPLKSILALEMANDIQEWTMQPLSGIEKYLALHRNSYRQVFHSALGVDTGVNQHVSKLANYCEVAQFRRPARSTSFGMQHIDWMNQQVECKAGKSYVNG